MLLLLLVEMLLFAMAFTRKCHTMRSGVKSHSRVGPQAAVAGMSLVGKYKNTHASTCNHTYLYTYTQHTQDNKDCVM